MAGGLTDVRLLLSFQVYSAEEKRALALYNYEEKQQVGPTSTRRPPSAALQWVGECALDAVPNSGQAATLSHIRQLRQHAQSAIHFRSITNVCM